MDARKTGELIALLRREKNMSQKDLAEKLDVTNKAISRWETGRGYPDIEILPELSQILGISVQELLEGERIPSKEPVAAPEPDLVKVCQYAGQQKRKQNRTILILLISLAVLVVAFLLTIIRIAVPVYFSTIIGSEKCVVAKDYSSLTYYGQKYVPLPLGEYTCVEGEQIVYEAQVEDASVIGKMFFGESLYEVKGVPDHSFVYLQTDHDVVISEYFVLEAEYEKYSSMLANGKFEYGYALAEQPDGYQKELRMDPELLDAINAAENAPSAGDMLEKSQTLARMEVRIFEENHVFHLWAGEFRLFEDGYYWGSNSSGGGGFLVKEYYPVPQEYSGKLDELFALAS